MTKDRLSQIWSGFSRTTSLDLSGTSVEGTPRPSREREGASYLEQPTSFDGQRYDTSEGEASLGGGADPVAAALSAMHAEMTGQAARGGRGGRRRQPEAVVDHTSLPASQLEQTLLADIAYTRSKTTRGATDYLSYAAERQAEWQKRKRKKFLGLF